MANQILAGAVIQAGMVIAGVDADNPPYVGSASTSSTVANKILMWNSDYAHSVNNNGIYSGSTSQGGLFMTDAAFANPLTLSSETPQSVAAGEGKVVSIGIGGEINVYNSSTGALEATFTDTLLDNGKASDMWGTADSCAIGAGKIFINSPEHNASGVGSIIVVDLLDRNVPSFLITPALGNYSRLGNNSNGRVQFIDGKVVAGTSQWSAPDMGIHIFDPDGSNHTFIPTSFAPYRIVKLGDNYVASNSDSGVEILDTSGQVLHSKNVGSYGFGYDIGATSTNKLVVRRHSHSGGGVYEQFVHIYDEGFTNEIIISQSAQPSTSGGTTPAAAFWCHETLANSAGFEIFGADILVAAPKASSDTVNESGAIYRYNDSGVLQEIFYGTVASQRLGTDIAVGTETTTTTPASGGGGGGASAPSISHYIVGANAHDINSSESDSGAVYVFDATDTTTQPVKLVHPEYGDAGSRASDRFGFSVSSSSGKLVVGAPFHDDPYQSGSAYVYDLTDLTAAPTRLTPAGFQDKFGVTTVMTGSNIVVGAPRDDDGAGGPGSGYVSDSGAVYVYNTNDLSATPTQLKAPDAEAYDYFGDHVSANSDKIAVTAIYGDETSSDTGAVYLYDANDLSASPTKLTALAADGTNHANLHFGRALAMSSDKLVVGTMDDTIASNAGAVYVYDLNDLSVSPAKLSTVNGNGGDEFGRKVAVSNDKIFISSLGSLEAGVVYVYDANDLSASPTELTAFDSASGDSFGSSLDAVSGKLIVGAGNDDDNGNNSGSVYVYDISDLTAQPTKLTAFDGAQNDYFGRAVAIG